MAITFSQLFAPNQVNNASPETLYTVPSSPSSSILRNCRVRFANTTAGGVTITAWAGAATDTNCFLPVTTVAAYGYLDIDVPVIESGGTLRAQAGAATSITATCLDGFIQS